MLLIFLIKTLEIQMILFRNIFNSGTRKQDIAVISFELTKLLQKYGGGGGGDNSVDHINHSRPRAISTSWGLKMGLIG